jgi:hypothetical protein
MDYPVVIQAGEKQKEDERVDAIGKGRAAGPFF